MLSLFIPLLFILGLSLLNSILFKKKFEYVLPVAIIEGILVVYIFGFIDLRIGLAISCILAVTSLPSLFFCKNRYSIKELFFTNLFWVFLLIYCIIFALNIGKRFYRWDEFSHWGMMVKELLRLEKYYFIDESVLAYHKEYPPFTTIFQYTWCKLSNGYKERHLYNSKIILSLSFMFPIFAEFIDKYWTLKKISSKICYCFLLGITIILTPLIVDVGEAALYRTIYTEYVLILLFLYGMVSLLTVEDDRNWFIFSNVLLLVGLLLTKQISIFFYAILILIYCCKCLLNRKKSCYELLFFVGIPCSFWSVWDYISKRNNISGGGQFAFSRFSFSNIINVLNGKGEPYQYETARNFFHSLKEYNLLTDFFTSSYVAIFLLVLGLLLFNIFTEKNTKNREVILMWGIGSIIGMVLYVFLMLILYLFCFSINESLSLACFKRYMNTMVCPLLILQFLIIVGKLCRKYQNHIVGVFTSVVFVLLFIIIPKDSLKEELLPGYFGENIQDIFSSDVRYITENTPENSKIVLIIPGDNGSARNIIAYGCAPRMVELFSGVSPDMNTAVEDYKMKIMGNDYLYIRDIDESFIKVNNIVFDNTEKLDKSTLYRIIKTDTSGTNILLEKISDREK